MYGLKLGAWFILMLSNISTEFLGFFFFNADIYGVFQPKICSPLNQAVKQCHG